MQKHRIEARSYRVALACAHNFWVLKDHRGSTLAELHGLASYPPYGFNLLTPTVNSNSAYRTLGEIMGVPVHDFPGALGPGLRNRMMPARQIDKLRAVCAAASRHTAEAG